MFQIGDLITGNERNRYFLTDSRSVCEVLDPDTEAIGEGDIVVRVVDHPVRTYIGAKFRVGSRFFKLLKITSSYECETSISELFI